MSLLAKSEFDMKIDALHALEDFLDAYDKHGDMVVAEAISNVIDVEATAVDVVIGKDASNHGFISFHNNGPAMNKKQFVDYHVIARSSKTKGSGIGFAGIGAKVYLAAWDKTVIYTETMDGKIGFASKMYVKDNKLKAIYLEPKLKKLGTYYQVQLAPKDFNYLEKNLENIIVNMFSTAMTRGLKITLNRQKISPWNPTRELKKTGVVNAKGKQFPYTLIITEDDIPNHRCNIQYHVDGKIISTRTPSFIFDIKSLYQKRFHVSVDAIVIADQLNLTKTNFKQGSGYTTAPLFQEVDRKVFKILEKNGYVKDTKAPPTWETSKLTKFFEKLFKDPKYSFLNPQARGALGGQQGGGSGSGSGKSSQKRESSHERTSRDFRVGGFGIIYADRSDVTKEGWLDATTNRLVINIGHALYIKYETDVQARNQRIGSVLTSVLIKNASAQKSMTANEAFDLQSELLTLAKDEMW